MYEIGRLYELPLGPRDDIVSLLPCVVSIIRLGVKLMEDTIL